MGHGTPVGDWGARGRGHVGSKGQGQQFMLRPPHCCHRHVRTRRHRGGRLPGVWLAAVTCTWPHMLLVLLVLPETFNWPISAACLPRRRRFCGCGRHRRHLRRRHPHHRHPPHLSPPRRRRQSRRRLPHHNRLRRSHPCRRRRLRPPGAPPSSGLLRDHQCTELFGARWNAARTAQLAVADVAGAHLSQRERRWAS